jgi:hypothetical protein
MKTMMEMLIQLQQLRRCTERNAKNQHLTEGEQHPLRVHKRLVRESLPADVVLHYDRLRKLEPELLECPEIFAMAVLTTTWRNLTPARRRALETHFTKPKRGGQTKVRLNGDLGWPVKSRQPNGKAHVPSRSKTLSSANQK